MPFKDPEKRRAYQRERYYRKKREAQLKALKEYEDKKDRELEGFTEQESNDLLNVPEEIQFVPLDIWSDVENDYIPPDFSKKPYKMGAEQIAEIKRAIKEV